MPSLRWSGGTNRSAAGVAHHAAADHDRAAVVALQPRDHAQRRGLAAARGAEQGDELAVLDREIDRVDRLQRAELAPDSCAA